MKHTLLFLLLLLSGMAGAQIITIPDTNFKNKLLSSSTSNEVAMDSDGNPIAIDANGDNEIQFGEAVAVHQLFIENSNIDSVVGIEAFNNLEILNCEGNNIVALDFTQLYNLKELNCSSNLLTVIDVSVLSLLETFNCAENDIDVLDVSALTDLKNLDCSGNNLATLDMSNNIKLETLEFSDNNLLSIFIKNGMDEVISAASWIQNPALEYICADDFQTDAIMDIVGETVNVNTYCSFIPGGYYNAITGTITFDADNNGCDAGDAVQRFIKVNIYDGTNTRSTFTNSSGAYKFYTLDGDFTVTPEFENNYFAVSPESPLISFPIIDNLEEITDICITSNGDYNDVEVVMVPIVAAQPGQNAVYKIVYKNKGSQIVSGSVKCLWDYTNFGNVNLIPAPDLQALGNYTWYYTDLLPFENREIMMELEVNSPTDTNPVNVGDILPFTATATVGGTDVMPDDNEFILSQKVVGSQAANNIICIEGESASPDTIGEYLHYVVNFENMGTTTAGFVVVSHQINPAHYDINTLQILNSSHEMTVRVIGNTIEFIFEDISLAAMDHGNILFKLKSHSGLQEGDNVINKANIFFDYNFPIMTNDAMTIFALLSTGDFTIDNTVKLYPNPSNGVVNISADATIESAELYDIQGRMLQFAIINEANAKLDLSARTVGIYILKIKTENGVKIEKIIKE